MVGFVASLVVGGFSMYFPPHSDEPRIEAIIQRGILTEIIIKCAVGTAIVSYNAGDRNFCAPSGRCDRDRSKIILESCNSNQ